jgi:hypothetical protein
MSYEAIREQLTRYKEEDHSFSESDKLLLDALARLTVVIEADFTQIKVALAHVARLIEAQRAD